MTENNKIDFLRDGLSIFIDYIQRQTKKNPDYKPHPLIRALELALYKVQDVEVGQNVMGVSQDGTKDRIYNPYIVIIAKDEEGAIEVKAIKNLTVNKELPLDIMIVIFRLQIALDRIPGDSISPKQVEECLNKVIPGNQFFALGNRWKEARDNFKKLLEEGKISFPRRPDTDKLFDELKEIRYDTPWEKYSQGARTLIGTCIKTSLEKQNQVPSVIITTPSHFKIEKFKVFDMASQFMLGKSAEYLNLFDKKKKG